jgi:hypothetical protein
MATLAGLPPVLLLVLLAIGIGPAGGTRTEPQGAAAAPAAPSTPAPPSGNDAPALVARVLGQERQSWAQCRSCPREPPQVRVLLATLPDPRDSHLPHDFDRYLDSIRRAGEAAEYVLVDFHLPWRESAAEAARAGADGPAYRRAPGVLVFRSPISAARPKGELLVVWLVGETPTTGVQRLALRAAFEQMCAVCDALPRRPPSCDRVPVLGPSFSGSIESLRAELHRQGLADPRLRFRIVSGSATAVDVKALVEHLTGGSSFHATVVPDAITLPAMIEHLVNLGVAPERIALLVEGNTSYGQGAASWARRVRLVPFPSQIGRLRRAYEQEPRPADGRAAAWDASPRLRRLVLGGDDTQAIDVPPVFSDLDSHSTEIALTTNLAALAREGVQYVGLLATDVRDKLFLGRQVRRFCPGAALFTLDADILFLHPDVSRTFEGMLVIAPYPLVGDNQWWSYPFQGRQRRLQFPSTTAQGVYNATLALLDRPERLESSAPFDRSGAYGIPPLWISVVGSDAFWPLRVIEYPDPGVLVPLAPPAPARDGGNAAQAGVAEASAPDPPKAPRAWDVRLGSSGWITALAVFQGLLWGLCLLLLAVDLEPVWPAARRLTAFAGPLRAVVSEAAREARAVYVVVVLLSCASLLLVVGAVATLGQGRSAPELLLYVTAPLLIVTTAWAARDGVPAIRRAAREARRDKYRLRHLDDVASAVSGGLVLALAVAFAFSLHAPDETARTFIYLRATPLLGGLSPLPPLVLLGLAGLLWGLCALMRVRLLDGLPDGAGGRLLNFDSPALPGLQRLEADLIETLSARTPGAGGLLLAWLVVGFPCWQLFVSDAAVPGFEGPAFRWLLGGSLSIVVAGTLVNVFAFHRLWSRLHPVLRRLGAQREIVTACEALDSSLSWSAMLDLTARVPVFTALVEAVRQARRFCDEAPADLLPEWVAAHARRAEDDLREALSEDAAGNHDASVSARRRVQAGLAKLAPEVLQAWQNWPRPERPAWDQAALAFVAGRVAGLARQVFAHMRTLLLFSTGSLLLVLLAVSSYPLEPRGMFLVFCWTLILGVVGATMLAFTAIERDPVLSALAHTTGGKVELNRDFLSRVLVHGGVPLLGLLAAQFPDVFRQILAWLEPLLGR